MNTNVSGPSTSSRMRSPVVQRIFALLAIVSLLLPQFLATPLAQAAGGAYNLKWYAADPALNTGTFLPTYAKIPPSSLACPTSSGGTGRAADPLANAVAYGPTFSNNPDAVTSLEPKFM